MAVARTAIYNWYLGSFMYLISSDFPHSGAAVLYVIQVDLLYLSPCNQQQPIPIKEQRPIKKQLN